MTKKIVACLLLFVMTFSMFPTSVLAADDMPRVGFMVRWQETQELGGGQPEAPELENRSTLYAYTDLYESVYLKPYIEGVQYPPGSIGWGETTYYTWEFQDVVNGVVQETRGAPFNQETVYDRSGFNSKYKQITVRNNTETGERLEEDNSCYRVIIRKYQMSGWSPNPVSDRRLGEASMDIHVRMTRVVLTGIQVDTKPIKTEYTEQDTLDLNGLIVTLTYSNGTTENVAFEDFMEKGISTSPAHGASLPAGDTTITVSKDGFSDTFNITVHPMPQAEAPSFSPAGGTYAQPQSVEISTATEDAAIYYTTDGSTPTTDSTVYAGPIQVDQSMTIKAIAAKDGMKDSAVSSADYLIKTYTMTATPATLSFGELYEGYTPPSGQTVTLTNTGTGTLHVALPTAEHFVITPGTGWNHTTASLAPNETATVTVTPKQDLTAGTYQDTFRFTTDQTGVIADVAASFFVVSHGNVTITPANITVYTGGEGYTGAVDNAGNESTTANGLPEPGYYITLPDELNASLGGNPNAEDLSDILKFTYEDDKGRTREWKLELYGTDAHSSNVEGTQRQRYIYRMLPSLDENGQRIPVRLQFTDAEGDAAINDEFTPDLEAQYQEYTINIYSGDLEAGNITAEVDLGGGKTVSCGITRGTGTLVVRGLTSGDTTTKIIRDEADLPGGGIAALACGDVTYYVNGSNVELNDTEGVRLLVDDVLDDHVLVDYIQTNMAEKIPAGDYTYAQQYLDVVDTKNGNAYLTMGENDKLTIYWKVPDDFDRNQPFYVVHFDALDRNYGKLEDELSRNAPDLLAAQLVAVKGDQYVKFDTSSFSPFVLVWETQDVPPVPTVKLTYHANHGSEDMLTYYYTEPVVTVKDGLFTRFDYTFDSWNTNPDGTGTAYMPSSTIHLNGDMDLYAQWIKNSDSVHGGSDGGDFTQSEFELHYRTDGGKYLPVESESHVWTKDYEQLPVPVREGYNFEGWYWDFRLTDPVFGDVKVDDPVVVLYAKWGEEKTTAGLTGVSRWLDTVHHTAYLSGYPGHSFGADRNMTRAEVAQMFYALLLDKDVKITKTFADVPADAWYAKAVNTLASLGMLGGCPDGTFQPDRAITRAEFAVVALAFADGGSGVSCSFTDVSRNDWFYQYAAQASKYGWMNGYPDGSFCPNNKITRAEVSVIVNNMLGRSADERFVHRNSDELVAFTDLSDGHWAYFAIVEAANSHTYVRDGSTEIWKAAA